MYCAFRRAILLEDPKCIFLHSLLSCLNSQRAHGHLSRPDCPLRIVTMPIIWGPGLTLVLQSLPSLIIPPALISTLPTFVARALPPSSSPDAVQSFLALPALVRALLSLVVFAVARKAVDNLRRRRDRKRLGPDVVEVPRMNCWLPGNLDFISEFMHSHAVGESCL